MWNTWVEDGRVRRELDAEATEAAKERLDKIRAAFEAWAWNDADRADRLAQIYNENFNDLVPRTFHGEHLAMPDAVPGVELYPHQKRAIWRVVAAGSTYVAHPVGTGKTNVLVGAVMEQKRLGLIGKALLAVPGHCLAQTALAFLTLYPLARILVADETNFAADKRHRFLARAATGAWDCVVLTHDALKLVANPAWFERELVEAELASYGELLERVDGEDRLARKRIERAKEALKVKLEALAGRKDDMITIAELGVDQILVDEAQAYRKLPFGTNMAGLKGVDPDGPQRSWDLWVKALFVAQRSPRRALVLCSGTPLVNTLAECWTASRFLQPELLESKGLHRFDAWAASFGETCTELELQPCGGYKPVTRFARFVNLGELVAMFRTVADVLPAEELAERLRLPRVRHGGRRIVTAPASPAFKAYQRHLGERIEAIRARRGPPAKGEDILLSVITDGRHAAMTCAWSTPRPRTTPAAS